MFPIQSLIKRSMTLGIASAALCAGLASPPAHALSCGSTGQSAKEVMPLIIGSAQRMVVGRITHKGATIHETWRSRSLATIAVEKDFTGGGGRSFQVMVRAHLPVGSRVLVFAFADSKAPAPPKGRPPRLMADDECGPTAFLTGSAEAQEYLEAIEALPPPGQGGTLELRLRAVSDGSQYGYLNAHMSEVGPQPDEPGMAAGKKPFEFFIRGPKAQRRLIAQWLPRKGNEEMPILLDHLPAGRYEIALPELPGYTLVNDDNTKPVGRTVTIVDRGLHSRQLRYQPNATVKVDVQDDLGRAVPGPVGLVFKRISALDPSIPFDVAQSFEYYPDDFQYLPEGVYSVDIVMPRVRHRMDADGKIHWTVKEVQRWPVPHAQQFKMVPGANPLAITLPASLRPFRVRLVYPFCADRSISVAAIGVKLGQQETGAMDSFHPDRIKMPWGSCLLSFDALPGQAFEVYEIRSNDFTRPRLFGSDSASFVPYLMQ